MPTPHAMVLGVPAVVNLRELTSALRNVRDAAEQPEWADCVEKLVRWQGAVGCGIEPSFVHDGMRDGKITTLCERGFDEDEGHHRLTSFRKIGVFAS